MKRPKVSYFKDKRSGWRFRVVAANGEILCQSERYERRADAARGFGDLAQAILDMA